MNSLSKIDLTPITLTGRAVRLEPLSPAHIPELARAGAHEDIWRYMIYGPVIGEEKMRAWVLDLLERHKCGTDLPFTVIHQVSGTVVGATRFMEIQPADNALEIGGTWYSPAFQRSAVNTECKYLLLRHAFEVWGVARVQFKADLRNERSQRALERIGALREGVLRKHKTLPDGYQRSSAIYSIIDEDWPVVKERLEGLIDRHYPADSVMNSQAKP